MPPTRGTRPGRPVDPSESRALHTILYSLNRTRFTGKVWIKVEWQWGRINTARDKVNPANKKKLTNMINGKKGQFTAAANAIMKMVGK